MTLAEIRSSDALMLTPADIAPILGCDPQCIRDQARTDPSVLGFPVSVIKTRTRIPRIPFLNFIEGRDKGEADI